MDEYLHLVGVYLKQELPEPYCANIEILESEIEINLPDDIVFAVAYDELFKLIVDCIGRVRERKCNLHFNIKAKHQERDFIVSKG